jgi:hypothetical protein
MAIRFTAKTETDAKPAAAAKEKVPAKAVETKAAEKPVKAKAKKAAKTDADDDTLL